MQEKYPGELEDLRTLQDALMSVKAGRVEGARPEDGAAYLIDAAEWSNVMNTAAAIADSQFTEEDAARLSSRLSSNRLIAECA